jgi:ligand-binding sensor domain-containing protein
MYKFLIGFLFILLTVRLSAQHASLQGGFALRNYTAIDGLPQSQVSGIVEDDNGYLWMGTYGGGLARFDGQEFKVYTTLDGLLNNIIYHLAVDSKKNLWMVHPRGITRYDGVTFKKFQASGDLSKLKMVRRVYMFQDTAFITSAPGVLGKIYKDSVYFWSKEYEASNLINRIHQRKNGDLCIFLSNGKVILKTVRGDVALGMLPKNNKVYSVYNFGDDVRLLLFSVVDRSMSTFEIQSNNTMVPVENKMQGESVLLFDEQTKKYWLRSDEALLTFQEGQQEPDVILKDTDINQVWADQEGNVWIASNGSGLFKYFYQDFSKCSSENMRGVMSILKDHEQASWIGTMNKGGW